METVPVLSRLQPKASFLFYPTTLPHAELIVPEDEIYHEMVAAFPDEKPYKGIPNHHGENYGPDMVVKEYCHQEHPHAVFAAMIRRLDKYVGELVDRLDEYGLRENTIIIFASDNGRIIICTGNSTKEAAAKRCVWDLGRPFV